MQWRLDSDSAALQAQGGGAALERFIVQKRAYVLRCASKAVHRYVTDADDEYAVGLCALYEAVKGYSRDKGPFDAFAALVIKRRILDHLTAQRRHQAEVPVGSSLDMDADAEDEAPSALIMQAQAAVARQSQEKSQASARWEIAALDEALERYGVAFFDLKDAAPRADKTRAACRLCVRWLIEEPSRVDACRKKGALPVKAVSQGAGVPLKTVERHRKYILAAMEILAGDYPHLKEYVRYITKQ